MIIKFSTRHFYHLQDGVGRNMVSAKSRDVDETSSACDNDPCVEGNMCYERDRGHGCLCHMIPFQGRDYQETPQLLTFHGGNSSALFSAKHGKQNEIKIGFKASIVTGLYCLDQATIMRVNRQRFSIT